MEDPSLATEIPEFVRSDCWQYHPIFDAELALCCWTSGGSCPLLVDQNIPVSYPISCVPAEGQILREFPWVWTPPGVSMSLDSTGQIGVRPGAVGCEEKQTRRMAWGMGQITWGFWEGSLSRQEREYWLGYTSRLGVSFNHPVAFPSECHHCLGIKINAQPPKWMI